MLPPLPHPATLPVPLPVPVSSVLVLLAVLAAPFGAARAEAPEIRAAAIRPEGDGWTVAVTIAHPDSGWDHYASGWEVLAPDGRVLGLAEITHPHHGEPFREELAGIRIPAGADHLLLKARCTLDGWSARGYRLDLPPADPPLTGAGAAP